MSASHPMHTCSGNLAVLCVSGAVCGMLGGVGALLGAASTYPGGLQSFLKNTSENVSVMAGAGTSIGM